MTLRTMTTDWNTRHVVISLIILDVLHTYYAKDTQLSSTRLSYQNAIKPGNCKS